MSDGTREDVVCVRCVHARRGRFDGARTPFCDRPYLHLSTHFVSTPFTCVCVCFTLVPSAAVFRFFVSNQTPAVCVPESTVPPGCWIFRILIFFFPGRVLISTAVAKQINSPIYYSIIVLRTHYDGGRPSPIFLVAFTGSYETSRQFMIICAGL